jgi:hypothetical protein
VWTITGAIVKPPHGFCASLDGGKAKFAATSARAVRLAFLICVKQR